MDLDPEQKMQFLFALRSKGVTDSRVLTAMERIDRGPFVSGVFSARAYEDMPLPIACGQTISQPSVVGLMTQALTRSDAPVPRAGPEQYYADPCGWITWVIRSGPL